MSAINVKGVEWTVEQHRNGTGFRHRGIMVIRDDRGTSHLVADGVSVLKDRNQAPLLERGTDNILECYATLYKPMWEQ